MVPPILTHNARICHRAHLQHANRCLAHEDPAAQVVEEHFAEEHRLHLGEAAALSLERRSVGEGAVC